MDRDHILYQNGYNAGVENSITELFQLTDEQKSDIHDRIAEMKAFKTDLRERASDLTDEEKQELRAEFIEKAKDMRHAWISHVLK